MAHDDARHAVLMQHEPPANIGQIRIVLKPATLAETEGDSLP